jgi:hypothetical protein
VAILPISNLFFASVFGEQMTCPHFGSFSPTSLSFLADDIA